MKKKPSILPVLLVMVAMGLLYVYTIYPDKSGIREKIVLTGKQKASNKSPANLYFANKSNLFLIASDQNFYSFDFGNVQN